MLQFLRTHQRLAQFILLIFIVPSFAFVGIEGYSRMSDGNAVAKVAGQKIDQQEWDESLREQANRLRQNYGQIDAKMFETPEFKNGVLENLLVEKAILAQAARYHLLAPDQVLQQTILSIPGLTKSDGSFDKDRYKRFLDAQGMTAEMFQEKLRLEMTFQRIRNAVQSSYFAPLTVADRISELAVQEREVQPLRFDAKRYLSKVKVTDDMLMDFYNKHAAAFEMPEQMKVEYVVLKGASAASTVTVTEADIKAFYEQNAPRYALPEERRAAHILVAAGQAVPEAQKAAAKKKAEEVLAQVRDKPLDFAKLAKKHSDDPGSAQRGGDLGFFAREKMVKPFSDAAFALKKGEISGLVESDFGYHIIKLTDVKPASTRKLSEVKKEISEALKKQIAAKKFSEMAEVFSNTVYEQADSLKPVAEKLKLKIETASGLKRDPAPRVSPDALYNNDRFIKAMFTDETIKNKRNSEAVSIGADILMAGRVVDYKPKTVRPFNEVKASIKERVSMEEATKLAKLDGEAHLAKLKAGGTVAGFGAAQTLSHSKRQGMHPAVFTAVMKADTRKLPVYVGVEVPFQGYGVYRVTKVKQPAIQKDMRLAERKQLASIMSQQEMTAYIEALKHKAKAEILKPAKAAENNS
ncbi:MAG: peptidylprolyl isomerase [Oxalobacter sp.]|nr:MAG: peptidylprolyl isomerase [Oxalobacter sp.]